MTEIEITPTNECLDSELLNELIPSFRQNQCVANARLVAEKFGYPCVEGVALVGLPPELKYIRHCWNMIEEENDDIHFDVTYDFCFSIKPEVIIYYPVAAFDNSEYEKLKDDNIFLSKAPDISEQLNKDIENENAEE